MVEKERVLILGAGGRLGSVLSRMMDCDNHDSGVVARTRESLDVTSELHLREWIPVLRPRVVVNCASVHDVVGAEKADRPCRLVNAEAVRALARLCAEHHIALVHFSSQYVFDGRGDKPYAESDLSIPTTRFGISKLAGEHAILQTAAEHPDFEFYIIRTANLFETPAGHGYSKSFAYRILAAGTRPGGSVKAVYDHTVSLAFADDLARAVAWLLENRRVWKADSPLVPCGLYHVANAGTPTWLEVARHIQRLSGFHVPVEPVTAQEYAARAGLARVLEPRMSALNCDKFSGIRGQPLPSWEDAIDRWYASLESGRTLRSQEP